LTNRGEATVLIPFADLDGAGVIYSGAVGELVGRELNACFVILVSEGGEDFGVNGAAEGIHQKLFRPAESISYVTVCDDKWRSA